MIKTLVREKKEVLSLRVVTIKGEGLVTGETTPREFEVSFTTGPSSSSDTLFNLNITGFASGPVLGSVDLEPDLTFFGCNGNE